MGRQERRQHQRRSRRRQQAQPQRRGISLWTILIGAVVALVLVVAFDYAATRSNATSSSNKPLARTIDGIKCVATEQLAYHIHIRLTLYDHGKPVTVPTEIGIPGGEVQPRCYYWIHIHNATPHIIHVESPIKKAFTLGNFFDIWEATNSSAQPGGDAFIKRLRAAAAHKQVTVFVEQQRWTGSYRSVPLLPNLGITIEIGKPTRPPKLYAS